MLEKLAYGYLYSHLVSCDLLNPNHSGLRPGDSTVNQLISITHQIIEAFDCNLALDVRSVYLYISKAFDRVWHDGLIYKLKRCGVSGQLLSLIKSFLRDRKQRTVLNGQCSNCGDILARVPQGSILGPLFLFTIALETNEAAEHMNHDLQLVTQWANDWRTSFNPDPQKQAVELLFSKKRNEIDHPVILFNNISLKR